MHMAVIEVKVFVFRRHRQGLQRNNFQMNRNNFQMNRNNFHSFFSCHRIVKI